MPQLGESVTEGTISRWLVQSGDHVNKYDPLAEVMTDKVNAEIPSSFTGTIEQLLVEEGTTLAVGETICTIKTDEADGEDSNETTVEKKRIKRRLFYDNFDIRSAAIYRKNKVFTSRFKNVSRTWH